MQGKTDQFLVIGINGSFIVQGMNEAKFWFKLGYGITGVV